MATTTKICSLERLLKIRREARAAGKTLVHCHGCFDIVHPGHIQYLQYARSLGDLLIVSVTADAQVNKGAARPLIPGDLRAASLAALECVDLVYVNPDATAVELLESLQPDIYVKGKEYEHKEDPRFVAEREMVTGHGGRVVFSSGEIVYSSTALISSLEDSDYFNDEKLARYRSRYDLTSAGLASIVQRFRGLNVAVIGDYILDRYHFCDATSIASEGPMMTLRALQSKDYDGGAAVIARHLAGLGAQPVLCTALADDGASSETELRLRSDGIDVCAIRSRRQLVAKHRYLVETNKLFKVDEGAISPLDSAAEARFAEEILSAAQGAAAVIFADFGYGAITAGLVDRVLPQLRRTVPVLAADVSGRQSNLLKFEDVDLLCPTEREVRETLHDFSSSLNAVVWQLMHQTGARNSIITLGKQGLIAFDSPDRASADLGRLRSEHIPALAGRVVDPLGCGDALLTTASLTLAAGGTLHAAALLGSIAAAHEAQQLGNEPLSTDALLSKLTFPAAARLAS
jgi:rfaE bifunctional protein kinase chain/domain/rfaE bifunctional protein nucleotidyltransferase chain/domain